MAKYVCNTDDVRKYGGDLCQIASEMKESIDAYCTSDGSSGKLIDDLSGWTGSAKDAFVTTTSDVMKTSVTNVGYINDVGEQIQLVADMIDSLENELKSFKI